MLVTSAYWAYWSEEGSGSAQRHFVCLGGTGSRPPSQNGWQRAKRLIVSQLA